MEQTHREIGPRSHARTLDEFAYGFQMRREAHSMPYNELQEPEQRAAMELLSRMISALEARRATHRTRPGQSEERATGFLISGQRGTGKTTVLFSVKDAFECPTHFFGHKETEDATCERIKKVAPDVIWLDTLDMQQLRSNSNLLTILLVTLRNALSERNRQDLSEWLASRGRSAPPPGTLRHETDKVWQELHSLIQDATAMWEPVEEKDPSRRASVQIDIAETNASFDGIFRDVVEQIARNIGQIAGKGPCPVLVLPIDNADRSIEHVYSVLKLMQMARCPNLWYLLSGSLADLDIFVERSFRDDLKLIALRDTAEGGFVEKMLGLARCQAASTVRAVLPPAHRILIDAVAPEKSLAFSNGTDRSLLDLLGDITVSPEAKMKTDEERKTANPPLTLRGYFVLDQFFSKQVKRHLHDEEQSGAHEEQEDNQEEQNGHEHILSQAGKWALMLPVRNLLDLWQNAIFRTGSTDEEAAVTLVHDILDNLIAESDLPQWACGYLRNDVIFRNSDEQICLDLSDNPLQWDPVFRARCRFRLPAEGKEQAQQRILSYLQLNDFYGFRLKLQRGEKSEVLPDNVSGWLMILHDLLKRKPRARINESRVLQKDVKNLCLVETQHEVLVWGADGVQASGYEQLSLRFYWPAPRLESFFDFGLIAAQWGAFLQYLDKGRMRPLPERSLEPRYLVRYLLTAWVDNICSVADPRNVCWSWSEAFSDGKEELGACARIVEDYARSVNGRIGELYVRMRNHPRHRWEHVEKVIEWLESDLPLLALPEYLGSVEPPPEIWGHGHEQQPRVDGPQGTSSSGADSTQTATQREAVERLYGCWMGRKCMLISKRFHCVEQAVERTYFHKELLEELGKPGSCCRERAYLRSATLRTCHSWFELLDQLVEENTWAYAWGPSPKHMPNARWPLPSAYEQGAADGVASAAHGERDGWALEVRQEFTR